MIVSPPPDPVSVPAVASLPGLTVPMSWFRHAGLSEPGRQGVAVPDDGAVEQPSALQAAKASMARAVTANLERANMGSSLGKVPWPGQGLRACLPAPRNRLRYVQDQMASSKRKSVAMGICRVKPKLARREAGALRRPAC